MILLAESFQSVLAVVEGLGASSCCWFAFWSYALYLFFIFRCCISCSITLNTD